jgi:hypothetical protein
LGGLGFLLLCYWIVIWETLPRIPLKGYYQQIYQDSNTKDVLVKEDDFLKLTRSQNSVFINGVEYDWEYLIVEKNYELVVFFGVFIYRFLLIVFIFFFLFFFLFLFLFSFLLVVLLVRKLFCVYSIAGF